MIIEESAVRNSDQKVSEKRLRNGVALLVSLYFSFFILHEKGLLRESRGELALFFRRRAALFFIETHFKKGDGLRAWDAPDQKDLKSCRSCFLPDEK